MAMKTRTYPICNVCESETADGKCIPLKTTASWGIFNPSTCEGLDESETSSGKANAHVCEVCASAIYRWILAFQEKQKEGEQ